MDDFISKLSTLPKDYQDEVLKTIERIPFESILSKLITNFPTIVWKEFFIQSYLGEYQTPLITIYFELSFDPYLFLWDFEGQVETLQLIKVLVEAKEDYKYVIWLGFQEILEKMTTYKDFYGSLETSLKEALKDIQINNQESTGFWYMSR